MIESLKPHETNLVYRIYLSAQQHSSVPIGPNWNEAQFREESENGGLVFRQESEISAFILYRDVTEALEISILATRTDSLRQGQMSQLLKELISHAEKSSNGLILHPKAVWLEVHEANHPARSLYEKLGFKAVGKRPRYYHDGGAAVLYNYG